MYQPVKRALEAVGNAHAYQKYLITFLFFIAAEVNYMLMGPTFIFMNPLFNCSFSDELVDESIACNHLKQCKISNSFTIVAKVQLYCDRQLERNIIQAIIPIGAVLGLIIVNFISDYKGRKFALLFVQIIGISGIAVTLLGAYLQSVWILALSQLFCGFSGYSMIIMAYILPSEFCQQNFRQKSVIIINYAWSATSVLLGILYYFYNLWYNYLLLFVLIPMIGVFLVSLFYLVEGPNFLYGQKRQKQCLQSLETIAIYNNRVAQFKIAAQNFKYESTEQKREQTVSLKQALKNKTYVKLMVILIFVQSGANMYYYGTNYALDEIGFDYGANMIATGTIQLLAFVVLNFTITKIPRKKGLIAIYIITFAMGLLFFIEPLKNDKIGSFIVLGILRFFGTMAYTIVIMFLTQSFPMSVQAICAGIVEAIAQSGAFIAPIVITICINVQVYPIIVLSFVVFFIVLLPLFAIPKDKDMVDKIQQLLQQSGSVLSEKDT